MSHLQGDFSLKHLLCEARLLDVKNRREERKQESVAFYSADFIV